MTETISNRSIQTYNLFGEAGDLPDVVHCETIAARSVLHEWEFAAHRHARLHQILLIARGGGQATLEGRVHRLRPMRVVNVPVGHVHGFSFSRGTQGWVLTVAAEMLDEVLTPAEGLRRVLAQPAVVRGTPQMRSAMAQIFSEFAGRHFARAHLLRALSAVLIGLVAREMAGKQNAPDAASKADLFRRFEALLDQHFLKHWTVSDYAQRAVDHADASEPPRPHGDRARRIAPDPRSRHPRGPAQSRLYQPAGLDDRLCARLQRPGLFQPAVFRGHGPVAPPLSRQDPKGRVAHPRAMPTIAPDNASQLRF